MCCVSNLDDTCARRRPAWLRVAPEEFKVDNGVWGSNFYKICKYGSPLVLLHSRHLVHALKDFFLFDGVAPALFLCTSNLWESARNLDQLTKDKLTS
jgi:hypothetical protein